MTGGWKIGLTFIASNLTHRAFSQLVRDATLAKGSVLELDQAVSALKTVGVLALGTFAVAASGAFLKAADSASKYQFQMLQLRQVLGQKADMAGIGNAVDRLVSGKSKTAFSQQEEVSMVRSLQGVGYSDKQIIKLLPIVSYAAEVQYFNSGKQLQPDDFVRLLMGPLRAYGYGDDKKIQSGETAQAVDDTLKAMGVAHISAGNIQTVEAYSGVLARTLGMSYPDVLRSIAVSTQAGVKPSMLGTSLRNVLLGFSPVGDIKNPNGHDAGLGHLGFLGKASIKNARVMFQEYNQMLAEHGMPAIDYKHMTAKAQETFAAKMLARSAPNSFEKVSLSMLAERLHGSLEHFKKLEGDAKGSSDFAFYVRKTFQKWAQGFVMLLATGGPEDLKRVDAQIKQQMNTADRAVEIRQTFEPMKTIFKNQLKTIFTKLGGVDVAGEIIPGGALDIVTHILGAFISMLDKVNEFGRTSPKAFAMIGTLLGVMGGAGTLVILAAATVAFGRLAASVLSAGAAAAGGTRTFWNEVFGGGVLPIGARGNSALTTAERLAARHEAEVSLHLGSKVVVAGLAHEGEQIVAASAIGGMLAPLTSKLGPMFVGLGSRLGLAGTMFARLGSILLNVGTWVARIAAFFLSWPVLIAVAIASIVLLWWNMPEKVGEVIGTVIGTIVNFFAWIVDGFKHLWSDGIWPALKSFGGMIKDHWLDILTGKKFQLGATPHGASAIDKFLTEAAAKWAATQHKAREAYDRTGAHGKQGNGTDGLTPAERKKAASAMGDQANIGITTTIHIHDAADPKRTAEMVGEHIYRNAQQAILNARGNIGAPQLAPSRFVG